MSLAAKGDPLLCTVRGAGKVERKGEEEGGGKGEKRRTGKGEGKGKGERERV
jgi:hypothetical protein